MLLTIFNLPAQTRYGDVKSLIHSKCGFKDVILDNLTSDSNNTKKVTVGLAEEEDAAILMRKINGLFVDGQQLYVTTIKKKAPSSVMDLGNNQPQPLLQQPYYQQSNQPNYEQGYTELQQSRAQALVAPSMSYGGMYGNAQNASATYGYPQQMQLYQSTPQQLLAQSMLGYDQGAPLGFSKQTNNPSAWSDKNDWNLAGNASAGNQFTQQAKSGSRWENTGDSRPRRDEPARDSGRDRPSRFGQDASPQDSGRNAPRRDLGRDAFSRDRGRDVPRDQGRDREWDASRDQGRDRGWGASGDQGRDRGWDASRDQGRDRGFDAPRDQERGRVWDAARDQGRDRNQGRDRGRDAPARPRGRSPARSAPSREPAGRSAPARDHGRDDRRAEPSRGPTKRQLSPPRSAYGAQATKSAPQMRTFSQQRNGPKNNPPNQPWGKTQSNQKAETNYVPPNKRPKTQVGVTQKLDKPQAKVPSTTNQAQPNSKKKKLETPERMQVRSATWRAQIASLIAKELMNNPKNVHTDMPTEQLITWLKRGIRSRLEELFCNDLEIRMPEMLEIYREKFNPNNDTAFFNQVVASVKASGESGNTNIDPSGNTSAPQPEKKPAAAGNNPPAPQAKNKPAAVGNIPPAPQAKKKPVPVGKIPPAPQAKKKPAVPVSAEPDTIPSYPEGDKRASKAVKKANAALFEDEEALLSQIDANVRQALVEEIDAMGPVVASEFDEVVIDEQSKNFCDRSKAKVIEEYKKMMKINMAKRLLNIGPIMLRIFTEPKVISRGKLAPILAKLGVTSLRKSQKKKQSGYFGTCDTYDVHDKLCNMQPITVDDSVVLIKPFQMTGKPEKPKRGKNAVAEDDEDIEEGDISDEFDDEMDEDGNLNADNDQSNIQDQNEDAGDGNAETNEQDDYPEVNLGDDEDTNGNIKMGPNGDQENIDDDNADNGQLTESVAVISETETEGVIKSDKDGNTEADTKAEEVLDFTADVDVNSGSGNKGKGVVKIDVHQQAEKNLSKVNAEELKNSKGNIIDEIDMADLNDDDLEDW